MIFINVIFRLLNFIILATLFYYVIKKFILPFIIKTMAAYDIFIGKLKDDVQVLQSESKGLEAKTDRQESEFQVMEKRFLLWQEKCRDDKMASIADQKRIERLIRDRFDVRSQVVMNELAIKEQFPYILDRATQKLQEKYQTDESQEKYIKELIRVMKEQS